MLVHHHPVVQKVLIGVFVWGMLLFGMRVAYGEMTFPLPTDMRRVAPLAEIKLPVDLPKHEAEDDDDNDAVAPMQDALVQELRKGAVGIEQKLKLVSSRIAAAKAKGVAVPANLEANVAAATALLKDLASVTEPASAKEIMEKLHVLMRDVMDAIPMLEVASNLPKVSERVEKEFSRLKRAVDLQRPRLLAVKTALASEIAALDASVASLRLAIDAVKAKGDGVGELYPAFEAAWKRYGALEAVRTLKVALRKIESQVKANDALIARLKSAGAEEAEALSLVQTEIKTQLSALKVLVGGPDVAAQFKALVALSEAQQKFEHLLVRSQDDGDGKEIKLGNGNFWGVPQFGPPSGLPGSAIIDVKGLESLKKMAPFLPKE